MLRPALDYIYNNELAPFKTSLQFYDANYKANLMFQAIVHRRSAFVAVLLKEGVDPVPFQTYVQDRIATSSNDGERAIFEVIEALLKS
jgi:hypothetical protein